jgi:hypothetical protein
VGRLPDRSNFVVTEVDAELALRWTRWTQRPASLPFYRDNCIINSVQYRM